MGRRTIDRSPCSYLELFDASLAGRAMVDGRPVPYVLVPRRGEVSPPPTRHFLDFVQVPEFPHRKRKGGRSPSPTPPPPKRTKHDGETLPSVANPSDPAESLEQDIREYTEEELDLGDVSSDSGDEIPIRRLIGFCIFDGEHLVSATELLGDLNNRSFTASGLVKPHLLDSTSDDSDAEDEEEDEDEDSCGQIVKGLQITELNIHHVFDGIIDEKIYIKTVYAWYILDTPAPAYESSFMPLRLRHHYTHHIVSVALSSPKMSYEEFVHSLEPPFTEHELNTIEIVEYFRAYIATIARELKQAIKRNIYNVPLIKRLQTANYTKHLEIKEPPPTKMFVTPVVGRIVVPRIPCPITVVGVNSAESNQAPVNEGPGHDHDETAKIRWGACLDEPGYYDSVNIDGIIYKPGDVAAVNPGVDADEQRAERAVLSEEFCHNSYARRVCIFFDDEMERDHRGRPIKKLHGVWFSHGGDTILQEINHRCRRFSNFSGQRLTRNSSQELFLLNECDDVHVSSIYRKCNVRKLGLLESEYPDEANETSTSYFYRFLWDSDDYGFKDPPRLEEPSFLVPECVMCSFVAEKDFHHQLRPAPNDGFTRFGYDYHCGDFVFVKPEIPNDGPSPFLIGQITGIEGLTDGELKEAKIVCSIQYYERYTEDERRLYQTRKMDRVKIERLDRVCWVKYIDEADVDVIEDWIKADSVPDRFYTNTRRRTNEDLVPLRETDFERGICRPCAQKHEQETDKYQLRNGPISCLDVFAGAGGLSEGIHRTGYFDMKWAIEQSPSAALTFAQVQVNALEIINHIFDRANHPHAKVLCADANDVLKYIVEREDGAVPPTPLRSSDGSIIPDEAIPRRGGGRFGLRRPPLPTV
ncbi:DNA (cytosine-5)-methyltransferase [Mycena venus]|uniref:DNA (Cytosine-5)-methyltransferase n=1 Tax=Mycena venus TaxID=2733690 RepID=A0A8H6YPX8_9AGAR|nr:DNA (cytosine-5)-methyltransferase [Mycena venus]